MGLEFVDISEEGVRVEYHGSGNDAFRIGEENARWYKAKCELTFFMYNPVTCVAASLVPHNIIRVHRQLIYYLPFTLISPLGSDDCKYRHRLVSLLLFAVNSNLFGLCPCHATLQFHNSQIFERL